MPTQNVQRTLREPVAFDVKITKNTFWSRTDAIDWIGQLLAVYEARHGMTSADFWQITRATPPEQARPLTRHEQTWLSWYDVLLWLSAPTPVRSSR